MLIILAAIALLSAGIDGHAGATQKPVTASGAWIELPGASATSTPAFAVVDNPTMYDIYIVSAATEVAGEVQFRQKVAGATTANAITEITAPAFGKVALNADGAYMLLIDLKRPLKEDETITLVLVTDGGLTLTVPAVVRKR